MTNTHIDLAISPLGDDRAELLDSNDGHDTERQTAVVLVLHDVDLLGAEIGDQTHAEGVGSGDTGLVVEELEPLLGQESQTDLAGMLGALAALDGSARSGSSGCRPGGGHGQGALG